MHRYELRRRIIFTVFLFLSAPSFSVFSGLGAIPQWATQQNRRVGMFCSLMLCFVPIFMHTIMWSSFHSFTLDKNTHTYRYEVYNILFVMLLGGVMHFTRMNYFHPLGYSNSRSLYDTVVLLYRFFPRLLHHDLQHLSKNLRFDLTDRKQKAVGLKHSRSKKNGPSQGRYQH